MMRRARALFAFPILAAFLASGTPATTGAKGSTATGTGDPFPGFANKTAPASTGR